MKKTWSLFVLALFLVSLVPIAVADEERDNSGTNMEVKEETKVEDDRMESKTEAEIKNSDGERMRLRTEIRDSGGVTKAEIKSRLEAMNATGMTKEEIRLRFEDRREELKEKLRLQDPEKLRRLEALSNVAIDRIAGLDKDQIEKIAALSRARQAELAGMSMKDIEEKLKEIRIKQVKNAEELKERVLTRQKIEIAKENFEKSRERYEEAKEKYQEARQRYLEAKGSGDEEAALEHAKEVLLKSADSIIAHLERIKAKIEENEQISEENAANITARIDIQISEVNAVKEKIAAAETKEQVKEAAKELRNKWKETKHKANAFAERVVTARVQGVVNQAEVLEKKLDAALARMEEQNITLDVDAEVAAFSSLVQDAKDSFIQAQAKLRLAINATDSETQKDLVDDAKSLIEDSRESLKDAHEKLKDIMEKIREAGHELEVDDDETVEVEDESEDEEETEDDEESEDEEEQEDEDEEDE